MSNTDQPTTTTTISENLACSLPENPINSSSSDTAQINPTYHNDKPTTDVDTTQVKNSTSDNDRTPPSKTKDFHLIKWIEFNYEQLPILLQNVNGPCPLLAIFNILLLQKRVKYEIIHLKHISFSLLDYH